MSREEDVEALREFIYHGGQPMQALKVLARLSGERERLREALERAAEQQPKTLAMIEANGFVFDDIGNEPGNWQHLAFSIYTDLCEVDGIVRAALSAGAEQKQTLTEAARGTGLTSGNVNPRYRALSAGAEQEGRPRPDFDPRTDYPERFTDGPI